MASRIQKTESAASPANAATRTLNAPELKAEMERRWRADNAEAIRLENEAIDSHGLPLARHRLF